MAEDVRSVNLWNKIKGREEFERSFEKPDCIVLDSEYSSMGRMIAIKACEKTRYTYFDSGILLELLKKESIEEAAMLEQAYVFENSKEENGKLVKSSELIQVFQLYNKAIRIALEQGPCLIHERGFKETIEAMGYSCMSIFTFGTDQKNKRKRAKVSPIYANLKSERELDEAIEKEDKKREFYHNTFSNRPWGVKETYDLCLNTEYFGKEMSIQILSGLMEGMN